MFSRKRLGLIFFCATACLVMDIKVEALPPPWIDQVTIKPWIGLIDLQSPSYTITTLSSGSTSVTASTIKTASESTLDVVSESHGVSTPPISTTATSNFTGNCKGSNGLGLNEVLLTVGLCIGIPLIIVIVALAVVIARLKKQLREALLSPKANQTTSSKNEIQQPTFGDTGELSVLAEGPYESLKPRKEIMSDGFYQSLDQSKKTGNVIVSSDI